MASQGAKKMEIVDIKQTSDIKKCKTFKQLLPYIRIEEAGVSVPLFSDHTLW